MSLSSRNILDTGGENELILELLSYSGGENTVSEDHVTQANEARVNNNWEAISQGGMERAKGFNKLSGSYSSDTDSELAHYHFNDTTGSSRFLGIINGDLVYLNGSTITAISASAFTANKLSHATDGDDDAWITNSTDNMKRYTIAGGIATPHDVPGEAKERVYRHKNRLVAEGGNKRIYISRAGTGNWNYSSIGAVVFTGSGLNDATSGGTYTGTGGTNTYTIIIDGTGAPNTFKWKKNSGSYTTGVSITAGAQTLTDGVTITFGATGGHTLNDQWVITVTADGFSKANDASSIDFPNPTKGCVPNFPSGDSVLVFTEFGAYTMYNFPNTAYVPISNSRGCSAPYTPTLGEEGVYFISRYPTKGVFLYDGTQFTDLTKNIEDSFIDTIDFSKRIFAFYRNRKYYVIYNETGSGVSYPNRVRVFNAQFGRWMSRPVNPSLSDNFGYPALLKKLNNEIYVWSSKNSNLYELETTDNSDENLDTKSEWKTKDFSSRDFSTKGGSGFIDEVKFKLLSVTVVYYGTTGNFTIGYNMDRGRSSGSLTFDLSAIGDLINTTFTVNSSKVISQDSLPDKTITKTFKNSAVGSRVNFQILHNGSSTRPKIKKIKIKAEALTEA